MAFTGMKKQKRNTAVPKPHGISDSKATAASSEDEVSEDDTAAAVGNAGWADSIAKILNSTKPTGKKTLVLSRAKKINTGEKLKPKESNYGFEIDGEVKAETKPVKKELEGIKSKHRKNVTLPLRVKPSWKDLERERTLRKVATRGVVQLFNAVRIQQKDIQQQLEEAGPLDSRKDAVLNNINKRKFLDVLMSGSRAKSEAVDNPVKHEYKKEEGSDDDDDSDDGDDGYDNDAVAANKKKRKSEWNVLRDDFMTNKKIKHWDEEEDNSGNDNDNESSSGDDDDEEN